MRPRLPSAKAVSIATAGCSVSPRDWRQLHDELFALGKRPSQVRPKREATELVACAIGAKQ